MRWKVSWRLLLLGLAMEACFAGMLALGDPARAVPNFLLLFFLAFWAYLRALGGLVGNAGVGRGTLGWVLGLGLAFRLTLLLAEPGLSDDVFRYAWDGRLLNLGVNPYRYPPGAPELARLRDGLFAGINHKAIGTPYGPVTVGVSALADRLSHSVLAMKTAFLAFDAAVALLLVAMLRSVGLPAANVAVYAWSPLVVVEVAGSGHNDPLAILLVLATLYLLILGRPWLAAPFMGLAVAAKYLAVLFLPAVWRPLLRRGRWVLAAGAAALAFAPFLGGLDAHLAGLWEVGSRWRFNDSGFAILYALTGHFGAAQALAGGLFAAVAVVVARWRGPVTARALALMGAALLLTTTAHPWYFLWMVPLLCFHPLPSGILLTGLVALSYHVLIGYTETGVWEESPWVRAVIYLPFLGVLLADGWRLWRRRAQHPLPRGALPPSAGPPSQGTDSP